MASRRSSAVELTNVAESIKSPSALDQDPGQLLQSGSGAAEHAVSISSSRTVAIIFTVAGVNFLSSLNSGVLTVALPTIAAQLPITRELMLWPASINTLTCGCTLLLAGSVADIVGRRKTFLTGCALSLAFTLGCGLSTTSAQLIVFRGLQGVSMSLSLTTATGILSNSFPSGQRRNIAFASLGAASPAGYTLGLFLGGLFASFDWRWAFHTSTLTNFALFVAAIWGLPSDPAMPVDLLKRLGTEIDWVGLAIASTALSLISYVMALITGSTASIHEPLQIALLTISLAAFTFFPFWMRWQEKHHKPATIPNRIWRKLGFSSVCIAVFMTWGALTTFEFFVTLFFQNVQGLSPFQSSLRFLPATASGILVNFATALLVKRVSAAYLVVTSSIISAVSCILMANVLTKEPYWSMEFPAVMLSVISTDVLFTVSNLIIIDAFPASQQSLAGGVFNTVAQIGKSMGLTIGAVIASGVTAAHVKTPGEEDLEIGYRATFWYCFASIASTVCIGVVGLRKAGKVGNKTE